MTLRAIIICLLAPTACAQAGHAVTSVTALPPGTTFPLHLRHTLRAGRTPVGTAVTAVTTQRIPLTHDTYLKSGVRLTGIVLASSSATALAPASLTLRLDAFHLGASTFPIATSALAVANFVAVGETSEPSAGAADRANPSSANWTTTQIGGQEIYRSGWVGPLVTETTQTVGFADFNGVYADPTEPGAPPRALGVFSTDARGPYGYGPAATLASAGPAFTLTAPGSLVLYPLDNLLLQLLPAPPSPAHAPYTR